MDRIRRAMRETGFLKRLVGVVEVDDTFIGGKAHGKPGRGAARKTMVVGVRERGGDVRAEIAKDQTANTLCAIVRRHVHPDAQMVIADEFPSYNALALDYRRDRINHQIAYVQGLIHTNSIESFWNILRRGVIGSYHKVSVKYLPNYLNEFCYRFSHTRGGNGVNLWKAVLANALIFDPKQKG